MHLKISTVNRREKMIFSPDLTFNYFDRKLSLERKLKKTLMIEKWDVALNTSVYSVSLLPHGHGFHYF